MVPVNYTNGTLEHSNLTYSNIDKLSISNIPTGSYRYLSKMCRQTLMNQLVSLWSIFSWSSRQNWLDYYQLKFQSTVDEDFDRFIIVDPEPALYTELWRACADLLVTVPCEGDRIRSSLFLLKTCCPGTKAPNLEEDDKFYEDFNMDEVDLNIENYEEIFGVALNDPEQLFGNDGIGSLFGVKDMSGADLNHRGTYAAEIPMEKREVNSSPTNEEEVLALELDLHPPNNTEVHDDDDDDDDGDTTDRPLIPNNTTDQGIDVSKAALLIGFFTLISGSMISVLSNLKDSGKTETNKAELTLGFKDIFLHPKTLPDAFYSILSLTMAFTVSTVLAVVSLWPIIKDRSFWYRTILFAGVAAFFLSFGYILKDKVPKFWLAATDSFSIPSFWLVWVYGFSLVLFTVTISSAAQLLFAFRHVG